VIKAGLLEGKALSADEVRQLADLEPREVLLAKLAGAMKASLTNAVSLFAAPLSQAVRTVDALRQKVEAEGGAAAVEAPAETAATADAPAETPAEPEAAADDAAPDEAAAGEPDTAEPDATEPTEG
ncbi:MAG TPA: hypothetical protein VKD67_08200, partial [Acidimicrobiales bacterium]|nr:hypothetical protein [Acidimicrobiales bacterium]